MSKSEKIKVGISIGDLNGIGSEVVLKTFRDRRMLDFCTPVIFASVKTMSFLNKTYGLETKFHGVDSLDKVLHDRVNVFNVWKEPVNIEFGKEDPEIGAYAIKSLEASVRELKKGTIDVLVTAPINKSNVQSETFNFPGHTDYLAKELGGKSLMLMISGSLRVGLLTDHVALKEITENIDSKLIDQKINTIHKTLQMDFGIIKPKIAVLGINPHTGDNGLIGNEDDTVLKPALDNLRGQDKLVFGPYAADSFFGSGNYKNFDAVIASYHDQGLIPFKTLAFGKGVNFTAGLNRVRTSPDHGTAYDLAGKNQANADSFKEALFAAISIFRRRQEYKELSSNPLQTNRSKPPVKKKTQKE